MEGAPGGLAGSDQAGKFDATRRGRDQAEKMFLQVLFLRVRKKLFLPVWPFVLQIGRGVWCPSKSAAFG